MFSVNCVLFLLYTAGYWFYYETVTQYYGILLDSCCSSLQFGCMLGHFKPRTVQMSFGQHFMDAAAAKRSFYVELNKVMQWESIARLLLEIYPVGKRPRGQKAYDPLLFFKMLLVGQWHKLSDRELELYIWDTLSARHFCGFAIEDSVPDHSTISRFRTRLVGLGA